MGQLIKVSTTDFKAIHLSSGGKLVPSDQIDQARGRALRLSTIEAQKAGKQDAALQYKVNRQYQRVENHLAYYSAMQAVSAKRTETGTDSLPLQELIPNPQISISKAINKEQLQKHWRF